MLRSDVLKDLYERNETLIKNKDEKILFLEREISQYVETNNMTLDLAREAKVNHSMLESFSVNRSVIANLKEDRQDTVLMEFATFSQVPPKGETDRLRNWLKVRTKADSVALKIN
jgi:hypothetical protein